MRQATTDIEFLEALTDLLRREGIRHLTVGELAARLRCSRRRLYGIAETKEGIFCAVVDHHFRTLLDEGEALIREHQDVTAAVAAYLDVGVRASARLGVQFVRDMEDCEQARASFDAYQQARALRMSELIDRGVHEGVFVPCHGLLVSESMLGAALRLRTTAFLERAGLNMEEAFKEFYRVLLGGLLVKAPGPPENQTARRTGRKAPSAQLLEKQRKRRAGPDDELDRVLLAAWNRT